VKIRIMVLVCSLFVLSSCSNIEEVVRSEPPPLLQHSFPSGSKRIEARIGTSIWVTNQGGGSIDVGLAARNTWVSIDPEGTTSLGAGDSVWYSIDIIDSLLPQSSDSSTSSWLYLYQNSLRTDSSLLLIANSFDG